MTWGSADPRVPVTNVPEPCRDSASPDISSSRYAFSTVAALTVHEVTTSRTVPAGHRMQQTQPHRLAHLAHQLRIDGHAARLIDMEVDHTARPFPDWTG